MAYDPWDWTHKIQPVQVAAPLAAMPQAQSSPAPAAMNTTGPLQQMVEQRLVNSGIDYALKPSEKAPVSNSTPPVPANNNVQVGDPMTGSGETMVSAPLAPLPTDAAAAQGAEIATAAPAAESSLPSIAAMFGK